MSGRGIPVLSRQAQGGEEVKFWHLGSAYACDGIGREAAGIYDCPSLVSRAWDTAGAPVLAGGISPTTHTMLAPGSLSTFLPISDDQLRAGDLALYDTCPPAVDLDDPTAEPSPSPTPDTADPATDPPVTEPCTYHHVVMSLGTIGGSDWMIHTNSCGTGVKIQPFWGTDDNPDRPYLGARTVARPN